MFLISPVDWSWSGTVSGFDPGVLLESWGRVAPSCPGTITTALVFGGTGREFSGVAAGVSLRMVAIRLGRARRRSAGNWPVRVAGSVIGLIAYGAALLRARRPQNIEIR